jgi:tetratricopeptide (TPR) repeat protein
MLENTDLLKRLETLRNRGRYGAALKLLQKHRPERGQDVAIEQERLLLFLKAELIEETVFQYEHMIAQSNQPGHLMADFASYLLYINETRKALELAQQAVNLDRESAYAQYVLSTVYEETGQLQEALVHALLANENNDSYHFHCAQIAEQLKNYELAEQQYRYAIANDDTSQSSMEHLVSLLAEQNRMHEALPVFEQALSRDPDDLDLVHFIGAYIDTHYQATRKEDTHVQAFPPAVQSAYQYYYMKTAWRARMHFVSVITLWLTMLLALTTVISFFENYVSAAALLLTYVFSSAYLSTILMLREANRFVSNRGFRLRRQ